MEKANSDYIDQLSDGNIEFRNKIIRILKRELPEEINTYYNHIQSENYILAAASVHKLKHKIAILGLEKSYYLAEQYEINLKDNSLHLNSDFEAVLKVMQEFVGIL